VPEAGQEPGVGEGAGRADVRGRHGDVEADRGHVGLVGQVVALRLERLVLTATLGDGVLEPEQLVDVGSVTLERVELAQADPERLEALLDVDDLGGDVLAGAGGVHDRPEALEGVDRGGERGDRDAQHQVRVQDLSVLVVDGLLVVDGALQAGKQVVDAVARQLRLRSADRDVAGLDDRPRLHIHRDP